MINAFEGVVKGHPNVIFVSGHEHTLQMIQDSNYNYMVSGSGSKTSRVSYSRNTLYASSNNGFATLKVMKNKVVKASYYNVFGDSLTEAFSKDILDFSKFKDSTRGPDTLRMPDFTFKDSAVISASDKYKHFTGLQKFVLGKNYREEWSTPVQFKVFNIRKEQGGFKIESLGGGKQTKSLKLIDKKGKEWTLRTIDKDPAKAIPENFRGTIGQALVVDMVSASNPYSPNSIPILAKAAGVPAAHPRFFYVPDDPALGKYRSFFANSVCLLEERAPTEDETDTKSTGKMINKLLEDNDHHVDQPAVLRARLLDMYIGDFDRHSDQWRWGTTDTGKGKLYYPVPKDRDQAFFKSNGLLLKYLSKNQMPFLQGFDKKINDINGFNFVARDFDRTFMNSLDKKTWRAVTDTFIAAMTDDVIKKAAGAYPPEIKGMDSAITAEKLLSRRKYFEKESLRYYRFLSKQVTVTGTNQAEYFYFNSDSGKLKLSVYSTSSPLDTSHLFYRRIFSSKETKELVVYGLNGNDHFYIDSTVSSGIKLRIVGGKGADTFDIRGSIKNTLYDLTTEKNAVLHRRRTDNDFSSDPTVLNYQPKGFQYDRFIFPQLDLGYNAEDKLLLGIGFTARTYGFRKEPYSTLQKLTTLGAINRGAFQASYSGVFNEIISKYDVVATAAIQTPTLNNFFGYGNETRFDKNLPLSYYRTRYKFVAADLLFRRRYNDIFQLSAGGAFYHYWNRFADNRDKILEQPMNAGKDSAGIYSSKFYAGLRAKFDISYINNEVFPTRGITWFTTFNALRGLNKNSNDFTDIQSNMTIYAAISDISKVSGVLRFGGGRIFSKSYEFFQAKTLGFNSYLRGFRRDRFAGRGMAYGSGEVRFRVFRSKSYILPGDVGMLAFSDVGRVWQKGEDSDKWHSSYGGGIYFIPFNLVAITASIGFSNEDRLFNFSVGTKFNLTF